MALKKWVRQPLIQVEGNVTTVGKHVPVRGVVHTTEGPDYKGIKDVAGIFDFWRRQNRGLGAHLVIDKEGNTGKGAPFSGITQAVYGANTGSIHVELVGRASFLPGAWWLRLPQLNKLAKWIAFLNKEYRIPIKHSTAAGWAGHAEFPGNDHWDPGPHFPWKYVLRRAQQYRDNGWT